MKYRPWMLKASNERIKLLQIYNGTDRQQIDEDKLGTIIHFKIELIKKVIGFSTFSKFVEHDYRFQRVRHHQIL